MMEVIEFSGPLCKAARSLAGLTQRELAKMADVADQTLADFERGARVPNPGSLEKLKAALERNEIVFIPGNGGGPGVRLRTHSIRLRRRKEVSHRRWIAASLDYRGKQEVVFVHYDILEQIAPQGLAPLEAFDRNLKLVLTWIRSAIEAGVRDREGRVHLRGPEKSSAP